MAIKMLMAVTALDLYLRQTVSNMSLVKSADKGLTWTRSMAANAQKPMWTNKMFSTGFFFKYGKNGGHTQQDEQDQLRLCHFQRRLLELRLGVLSRPRAARDDRPSQCRDWQYYSDWQMDPRIDRRNARSRPAQRPEQMHDGQPGLAGPRSKICHRHLV